MSNQSTVEIPLSEYQMVMKKNTCDTCHYWDVKSYVKSDLDPRRPCKNPRIGNDMAQDCISIEGYEWECITTGPKFGCMHHATVPVVTKRDDKP